MKNLLQGMLGMPVVSLPPTSSITSPARNDRFIRKATPETELGKTGHTTRPLLNLDHLTPKEKALYLVGDLTTPANPRREEFINDLLDLCARYSVK